MNIKAFVKNNYKIMLAILIVSCIPGMFLKNSIGLKDAGMFCLATACIIFEIYYAFVDIKKSILLFIVSFPILVTARKVLYVDILFLKITYEAIYIQFIFILCFKKIINFIKNILKRNKTLDSQFLLLIIVFVIFGVNASVFSETIMTSLGAAYLSVIIPVMFVLSVLAVFDKKDVNYIIYALILSMDLSCMYGFAQIFMNHIPFSMIRSRRNLITFGYHNINIFAGLLIMVFPVLAEKILYNKKSKNEKIFLYLSAIITLGALFITYSRGAWISALFAVMLILCSKKYKKYVYVFIALLIIGAPKILPFILHRGKVNAVFFSNESMVARVQSIFTSAAILFKYPFGTGSGSFATIYNRFAVKGYLLMPKDYRIRIPIASYPLEMAHNLFLQIAVELGIVCVIVFLIILINRLIECIRNYSVNRGIFVSIIVYMIFSVTTGTEFNHKGIITGTLMMWIMFGLITLNNKEGNSDEVNN